MTELNTQHIKSEPWKDKREECNLNLKENFGTDTISGLPIWRVSWAPGEYEKRFGTWEDYTQGGIYLRTVTEAREVPKYPHLPEHYILERLVIVPMQQVTELCGATMSYEPIHPFWNGKTEPLPPNWMVCKFVVDTVYAAMGKGSLKKYTDPNAENNGEEARKARVKEIYDGLYGNDTPVTDALTYGTGVFMDSTKQGKVKPH